MKPLAALLLLVNGLGLAGCSGTGMPTPTVTVTAAAVDLQAGDPTGDEWQRFRDDPREAFIFASAYELIMGSPIGNGETADSTVEVVHSLCGDVADGKSTWDELEAQITGGNIDAATAEQFITLAQVYCPELSG